MYECPSVCLVLPALSQAERVSPSAPKHPEGIQSVSLFGRTAAAIPTAQLVVWRHHISDLYWCGVVWCGAMLSSVCGCYQI